jgi:hypothetical protein
VESSGFFFGFIPFSFILGTVYLNGILRSGGLRRMEDATVAQRATIAGIRAHKSLERPSGNQTVSRENNPLSGVPE